MPLLANYQQFAGRHWETGTVHNYYAYRGVKAPHTGQPYSEALLMGVSGGIVMGYFSFAYEGYLPHVALLTRNTFDPLNTLLARLGVEQTLLQTSKPAKAVTNLTETLAEGIPAIVWADMFSLPYNITPIEDPMWAMFPILVYGYDEAANTVWIADRAQVPLTVTTAELAAARARVKDVKFRILTLDQPDPDKVVPAVQKGIWDCIKLFTEPPPKGSKNNFGFAAYKWWADLLTKPKQRLSWEREFPAGAKLYAGLTSTVNRFGSVGIRGDAERGLYADFLGEASLLLNKPDLKTAAQLFRQSAEAWATLTTVLLPDEVPLFQETRALLAGQRQLFRQQGGAARAELQTIQTRLTAIQQAVAADFPLTAAEVITLRQNIAAQVMAIHDIELMAIKTLQEAMR